MFEHMLHASILCLPCLCQPHFWKPFYKATRSDTEVFVDPCLWPSLFPKHQWKSSTQPVLVAQVSRIYWRRQGSRIWSSRPAWDIYLKALSSSQAKCPKVKKAKEKKVALAPTVLKKQIKKGGQSFMWEKAQELQHWTKHPAQKRSHTSANSPVASG